jgi:hypothetical protein
MPSFFKKEVIAPKQVSILHIIKMSCYDPTCPCSNAPKCKCQLDWDVRCVCPPGDSWNCPVRVNTAVWLIDNDADLHKAARERRRFDGILGWFNIDDRVSFWKTVALYSQNMIDELQSEEVEDTYKLCCWLEEKKEAESMIAELEDYLANN